MCCVCCSTGNNGSQTKHSMKICMHVHLQLRQAQCDWNFKLPWHTVTWVIIHSSLHKAGSSCPANTVGLSLAALLAGVLHDSCQRQKGQPSIEQSNNIESSSFKATVSKKPLLDKNLRTLGTEEWEAGLLQRWPGALISNQVFHAWQLLLEINKARSLTFACIQ